MYRFYSPATESGSDQIVLTGAEAHHASHVLRLRRGDTVTVLDGEGGKILCAIQEVAKSRVQLTVTERKSIPPLPYSITLLQAIPKGKLIEFIIQKATELGATRIVPLLTERVATRLDEKGAAQKAQKWQQVAIEAIKQCGAAWLPKVESPVTPAEFLARNERFDLPLIASLQPGSRNAREYFHEHEKANGSKPRSVCIWVGPEGDFTPQEVAEAEAAGARPISLGRLVLRCDTAAIFCLSVLNYELQSGSGSHP